MALGQYIPKLAALQATPIVDPDTGMASVAFMMRLQAMMDRIGGTDNPSLPNYATPLVANSATGLSGNAPALVVGSSSIATVAGSANAATNLVGGTQLQPVSWSAAQTFNTIKVVEGTNTKQGTATLALGTVTVANTSVTATSRIFLTRQGLNASTAMGELAVASRSAGVSFTITSYTAGAVTTQIGDLSTVAYLIHEVG